MTKEEKKLLLNVLKDGLPYGLKLQITDVDEFTFNGELRVLSKNWCRLNITDPVKRAKVKNQTIPLNCIYIKPYLRPLSSMTEEEKRELNGLLPEVYDFTFRMDELLELIQTQKEIPFHYIDWLNAHHFDYRGLIPMGLALEAPEDMYKNF